VIQNIKMKPKYCWYCSKPNFSTLEGAAVQGGVVGVLSNSNPNDPSGHYTVFAPTNDAFAN
jgi:uncharacterized surface protein with fasciclin (FAS1) repeats